MASRLLDQTSRLRLDSLSSFLFLLSGYLAVSRALGDSAMKQFVVGSPYTTETTLGPEDEYLIIACDGVSSILTAIFNEIFCIRSPLIRTLIALGSNQ